MTTTKEAAGLVERLEELSARAGRVGDENIQDVAGKAAQEIRILHAQVEDLRRENAALRGLDDGRWKAAEARATKAEAGIAEAVSTMTRLCTAAGMLQQNSEGCAVNHYGHDFEIHGLPGWLADTKADIAAARAFVEKHKP